MSAPRCSCGYLFEVEHAGDDTHAVELEAQQERIYLDYLAARTAQAEEAYRVAKRLLEADPESVVKSADVLVAQQQMHAARAELASQTIKTRAAMACAQALRKSKPAPAVVKTPEPVAPERRGSTPPKTAHATSPAKRLIAPEPIGPDPSATASRQSPADATPSASPAAARPTVALQVAAPPAAPAPTRPAPDTPKVPAVVRPEQPIGPAVTTAPGSMCQPADAPSRPAAAATAVTVKAAPPPPTTAHHAPGTGVSTTATPPPAAKKAGPNPAPSMTNPGAATPSAQPTPAFREAQAARAKDIVARRKGASTAAAARAEAPATPKSAPRQAAARAAEETKDCPSCTATVALPVMRCRCGFTFSRGVELPGVVLTPAERTTLLQGFESTPNPRKPA